MREPLICRAETVDCKEALICAALLLVLMLPLSSQALVASVVEHKILESQASAYANGILPDILSNWNVEVFSDNAHPYVWQQTTEKDIERAFFFYQQLGDLQQYGVATGTVVISEAIGGDRTVIGSYVTHSTFENGDADVSLIFIKDSGSWLCAGIVVASDSLYERANRDKPDPITQFRKEMAKKTADERTAMEDKIMAKNELGVRRRYEEIIVLAELRSEDGNSVRAAELYRTALRGRPTAFDAQLKLAELEFLAGNTNEGIVRALTVYRLSESSDLFERATDFLSAADALPPPPAMTSVGLATNIEFILVRVGPVHEQLLKEL